MLVLQNFIFGLNFYFICITDILTKQYNNNEIQTLYKWDSEGSQMTYLNLYLNLNFIFGHSSKIIFMVSVVVLKPSSSIKQLKSRGFRATSVSAYDFSTFYTTKLLDFILKSGFL